MTLACLGPGPAVATAGLGAGVTVVNLWASWCGPCRVEMPRLRQSAARLGSRAVFLGVDTKDTPDTAWAFLRDTGVHYAQVVDPDGSLLHGLRLPGLPVTYVLDRSGAIVFRHIGELHDPDIADLEAAVTAAQ